MRLEDCRLLTDENIHSKLLVYLRFASEIEVESPFVVVAQRKADDVTIRVRTL